ncbi:PEP-CTERM sorting domain-containing protein [Ruficoccus sp. ZRK36]|uniref:PEP-CTERM sorting domain-containing protein n=1 Tax=Ruficoccus sp. ZRK36 TaxID=2866311 RepID=UPI001C72FEF7|nr:PEP-CTERM sorting domain-containing protein [Ruficoccus sp. ZRK36]QYY35079.1 PEP-CTERM sorting domain-containing protein [Ruficoccus sp. ZRK36]
MKNLPRFTSFSTSAFQAPRRGLACLATAALGLIGLSASANAQTLYWNGGFAGDQAWSTSTDVTAWSTTPTGSPETYWVNGSDAVFTTTEPEIIIWTATANNVTVQDGAIFTVVGTGGRSLTITGGGSGDFTIQDNDNSDGVLRLTLNGSSAWDGTITAKEFGVSTDSGLIVDSAGATGIETKIALDGGAFMLGTGVRNSTVTIGELSGTGSVKMRGTYSSTGGVRMLKVDQSTNTTFSGTIGASKTQVSNVLAFTKAGTGTLTVSSASGLSTDSWGAYTGVTNIEGGALYYVGSSDTTYSLISGQGAYTLYSGATLGLDGTINFGSSVSGVVTVQDGGILDPGRQNGSGTMTLAGGDGTSLGLVFEGTANVLFNLGTEQDQIVLENDAMVGSASGGNGSVTFTFYNTGDVQVGQTYNIISFGGTTQGIDLSVFALSEDSILAGWAGTFGYGGDGNLLQFTVTSVVPEPATTALIAGLMVLGVVVIRRRRRS